MTGVSSGHFGGEHRVNASPSVPPARSDVWVVRQAEVEDPGVALRGRRLIRSVGDHVLQAAQQCEDVPAVQAWPDGAVLPRLVEEDRHGVGDLALGAGDVGVFALDGVVRQGRHRQVRRPPDGLIASVDLEAF